MKIWLIILVCLCASFLPVFAGEPSGRNFDILKMKNSGFSGEVPGGVSAIEPLSSTSLGLPQNSLASNPYVQTYGAASQQYGGATPRTSVPANAAPIGSSGTSYRQVQGVSSRTAGQARVGTSSTAPGKAYEYSDSVTSGGIKRSFIVHIPASYDRRKPMPVILAFHGLGMTGSMMMYLTNFNYYADKQGFIAVYPNANGGRWEDGRNAGADDVQFVTDLIAKLSTVANVDQRKIYAAGLSNGGHFVRLLAGQSNRIAAIAIVSSSMMTGAASSARGHRMPVVLFLGMDDPLVPSSNSAHNATLGKLGDAVGLSDLGSLSEPMAKMGGLMTAEETVDFWCKNNGCSSSPYTVQLPDKEKDGTRVTRHSYGGYGSEVVFYSIAGGGHSWPGSLVSIGAKDILGRTTLNINASEVIADFFLHH